MTSSEPCVACDEWESGEGVGLITSHHALISSFKAERDYALELLREWVDWWDSFGDSVPDAWAPMEWIPKVRKFFLASLESKSSVGKWAVDVADSRPNARPHSNGSAPKTEDTKP